MVSDERVTYSMQNGGLILPIKVDVPDEYFKAAGMSGSGIAPTTLTINDSIGGGGRWRSTRRNVRSLDFPVLIFGNGARDLEKKLVRLTAVFNDRYAAPLLVARYPDGTEYEIEFHYAGGGDHEWGQDTDGRNWVRWPLSLTCPDPYWTKRTSQTFPFRTSGGRGLIKNTSLSKLRISGSQALGTINVTNSGDVDAFPVWQLKGPADGFVAVRNRDGATLPYEARIDSGDTVFLNTLTKTVYSDDNPNLYEGLGKAPKFFSIPPGQSSISVELTNATGASSALLTYRERREFLF